MPENFVRVIVVEMEMRPALIVTALLFAQSAVAMAIAPVALWELVEKADVVVVADVGRKWERPGKPNDFWARDRVELNVVEMLKGDARTSVVVRYTSGLMCPAPDRYEDGKRVLAFLRRDGDEYQTVGLSYGTLYPAPDELDAFRARIREAIALSSDPPVSDVDRDDWNIRAASHPATRWHGLSPMQTISAYTLSGVTQRNRRALRDEQKLRLARIFLAAAAKDDDVGLFIDALAGFDSHAVDVEAAQAIMRMSRRDFDWYQRTHAVVALLIRLEERDLLAQYRDPIVPWTNNALLELQRRHPDLFMHP